MGETSIEWCDYTFNPWIGCTKVSAGCANCYAEKDTYSRVSKSRGLPLWGPTAERRRTSKANWRKPLTWNRNAAEMRKTLSDMALPERYRRPRVFCASLADAFEDHLLLAEWRADLWKLIEACPELDWLLLTKRPENVLRMVPVHWLSREYGIADGGARRVEARPIGWPDNVFVGTSVEDQRAADERLPHLLRVPAPVRFLSMEPLLGPVDVRRIEMAPGLYGDALKTRDDELGIRPIDWVIVGGESGHGARPMHPSWAKSIRDQCIAAGVPFFFKQWGEWRPSFGMKDGTVIVDDNNMRRIGKKVAGRLLDGRTWDEIPEVRR